MTGKKQRWSSTRSEPNYRSGFRGRNWTTSLRTAQKHGAVIVVEESGEQVQYDRLRDSHKHHHWRADDGTRYESRDCIPLW